MAHINLLPWRESLRQQQKQQYLSLLLGVGLMMLAIAWLASAIFDQLIASQEGRNQYLEQQISILDAQISQIKDINDSKKAIEQRMALIEQLQTSRNVAPIILDELVKLVPPGISFRQLSRKQNNIEITGVSESNNRLADFMRRLDNSEVFINAELSSIVADTSANAAVSDFKLTFVISEKVAPRVQEENSETNAS